MFPELTAMERLVAIYPKYIVSDPTTFRVQQHGKDFSSDRFTIFEPDETHQSDTPKKSGKSAAAISHGQPLMYVDGKLGSMDAKRSFRDASGLSLFELYHRFASVTWHVELSGRNDSAIARLAPRTSILKDKLDVSIKNAAVNGEDLTLYVRGQDIWKQRTNVYLDGKVVITAKRTEKWSVYLISKELEWVVNVAAGMDIALASVIVVVLAANMYDSSMQSSISS